MSNDLSSFKEKVQQDDNLKEEIKKSTVQQIVLIAKAMGYNITAVEIDDLIKLKGDRNVGTTSIIWDHVMIIS